MKIKIIILIVYAFNQLLSGQSLDLNPCFEIKHLDFFGLDKMEKIKWPQSELDGLIKMDFEKEFINSDVRTNFIVPMIVFQIKDYHPKCNNNIDTVYFDQLIALYSKIRKIDPSQFTDIAMEEKINFIRDDFYTQVRDVKALPQMTMTFDDGPFYGIDFTADTELEVVQTQKTTFGQVNICKSDDTIILKCQNNEGHIIWQKVIIGLSNRKLTDLHFSKNPVEYNSLATIAHMYSEGERFTLYLGKKGSFMYYYHSW